MGVQRDVGGNPSIPPSSFWAQRSAQPVGINKRVLSKCIRIVIVAFGARETRIVAMYHRSLRFPTLRLAYCVHRTRSASVPLRFLLMSASRMGYDGDFIPMPLTGDIVPRPLLRFARF